MTKTQVLGRIVIRLVKLYDVRADELLGPIEDLLDKLAGGFDVWMAELKKFLRKEPCWVKEVEVPKVVPSKRMDADTHMWALSQM